MSFKLVKMVRTKNEVMKMYTKKGLMEKVIAYFDLVEDQTEEGKSPKPTISGLAIFLGFPNKKYMMDIITTDYGDVIEFGISMIEMEHEKQLYNAHVMGAKFWLSTIGGWSDKKEEEDKVVNVSINGKNIKEAEVEDIDETQLGGRLVDSGINPYIEYEEE